MIQTDTLDLSQVFPVSPGVLEWQDEKKRQFSLDNLVFFSYAVCFVAGSDIKCFFLVNGLRLEGGHQQTI